MIKKYRVWDINRKEMTYPENTEYNYTKENRADNGGLGYFLLTQNGILMCNDGIVLDDWHDNFKVIFTIGKKDEEGLDIYEDDLVIDTRNGNIKGGTYRIKDDTTGIIGISKESDEFGPFTLNIYLAKLKIVGNIYEDEY